MKALLIGAGVSGAAAVGFALTLSDPPPLPPEAPVPGWDGRLLALADADMAATAYADGALFPLDEAEDAVFVLDPARGDAARLASVANTVMGWPGSMTVSADGGIAYVVTSRGRPPAGTDAYDSVYDGMPYDGALTTADLASGVILDVRQACGRAMSVDLAPSGAFLVAACADDAGEIAVIPLDADGVPGDPRVFDLAVRPPEGRAGDAGATFAAIHPGGAAAGVILKNRAVALVRFDLDAGGVPVRAAAEAPTPAPERWLSVGRWTRTGEHFLASDVAWGPAPLDAVLNGPGALVSYALSPEAGATRGEVSAALVSKSPEGFALNRAGDLAAVVNMERTYLPGGFMALFRGRDAASLSLVEVRKDGTLAPAGPPVRFRGVLPEDAAFDADGDRIAVAVYQDHGAARSDGWVAYFAVEGAVGGRRLRELPARTALPRGPHDLEPLD